jgi:Flp pilus assembly protein TadD
MSRRLALAATAVVLGLALAAPVQAWPFGKKTDAPAAATAPATPGKPTAVPPQQQRKATPAERAQAERMDPLIRAAFWARETDVDPADAEAGLKLSQALRAVGRNDESVAAADRVLVMHPENEEALLELARSNIARNQGFFAIDPAQRAAVAAPRDWRAPSLLGVALEQVSRTDEARVAWATALRLSPENPAVLSNMAMSYFTSGDAAQAETLLRRAVAQPGATLQTRQDLALVLGIEGKMTEAEHIIRVDLPPETAEQNLAWLRARINAAAAKRTPVAATPAPAPGRTWNALQGGSSGTN